MKVSIIVPVYKAERYLSVCLDSLVGQSLDDYEIILINDGSPDGSGDIIAAYEERYPDRIRSLTVDNGGQGRARNFGLDMARGDFIGFADSDDWVDLCMYEKLYNAAVREDADVVLCDCVACGEDGTREYMSTSVCTDPTAVSGSVWNKLFRREKIGELRFPVGVWYEDMDFAVKLMLTAEKTASVPEGLYFYRVTPESTMRNHNARKNLDIITVTEDIRSFAEEKKIPVSLDGAVVNHILLDAVNRVARQNAPDKAAVIRELLSYVRKTVPHLRKSAGFRRERVSRRMIMALNYVGLWRLSALLLKIKSRI